MKRIFLWMTLGVAMLFASCQSEPVKVAVIATSDLETSLFSYDYKNSVNARGGAHLVASYIKDVKSGLGAQNVVYVDNGDILAGWPLNHYMKSIDKSDTTLAAAALNALGCEVYNIGEGDLAQGKELLSRHVKSTKGTAVCANIIDAKSGQPLYKPYKVVERGGMKIAFLGLTTEWADKYMNASCLEGIKIENAEESAKKWIAEIKKNEQPDVVIGLFHTGASSASKLTKSRENIAVTIARNVGGFDAIVCGHDGMRRSKTVDCVDGNKVVLASPGRRGLYAVNITVTATPAGDGFENKKVDVAIQSLHAMGGDLDYSTAMRPRLAALREAMGKPVGTVKGEMNAVNALFGPSSYLDFVHKVQLEYSGADMSFAHPHFVNKGCADLEVRMPDIYNFYPMGGKLYTVKMKGSEIRDMLLYSITRFYKNVTSKDGALLKYNSEGTSLSENCKVLESVAGLRYTIHHNKKKDEGKLQIAGLANGKPFSLDKEYTVAVGEDYVMNANLPLSLGAKLKKHMMEERVVAISEKDMSELIYDYIAEKKTIDAKPLGNWSVQPAAWMGTIKENEMKKLSAIYMRSAGAVTDDIVETEKE